MFVCVPPKNISQFLEQYFIAFLCIMSSMSHFLGEDGCNVTIVLVVHVGIIPTKRLSLSTLVIYT